MMRLRTLGLAILLYSLTPVGGASGQAGGLGGLGLPERRGGATDSSSVVETSAHISSGGRPVAPGSDLVLAVVLDQRPGWHVHTNDPDVPPELGDAENYIATTVAVTAPPGSPLVPHPGYTQWPEPVAIEVAFLGKPVLYQGVLGPGGGVRAGEGVARCGAGGVPARRATGLSGVRRPDVQAAGGVGGPGDGRAGGGRAAVGGGDGEAAGGDRGGGREPNARPDIDDDLYDGFDGSVWPQINAGVRPAETLTFDLFGLEL